MVMGLILGKIRYFLKKIAESFLIRFVDAVVLGNYANLKTPVSKQQALIYKMNQPKDRSLANFFRSIL